MSRRASYGVRCGCGSTAAIALPFEPSSPPAAVVATQDTVMSLHAAACPAAVVAPPVRFVEPLPGDPPLPA